MRLVDGTLHRYAKSMNINLGPFALRYYGEAGIWSSLELAYVSNRHCGLARRESAVRCSWKSEHSIEAFGLPNPADAFTATDGSITYGRIVIHRGHAYAISAEQLYTANLLRQARQAAREAAEAGLSGSARQPALAELATA